MEDSKIVELYWERSESAISETKQKYGNYCRNIALNILSDEEDAKECVNDTYLRTWNSIPTQRPSILSAYLGKITRNLSLNKYKQRNAEKRGKGNVDLALHELEECISVNNSAECKYEDTLIAKAISEFLRSIEVEDRLIFVRRYWYLDSIADISKKYKMSESKVKSMLFRSRNKLRIYLEKEGIAL